MCHPFLVSGLKKPSEPMKDGEEGGGSDEDSSEQQSDKPAVKVHLTPLELEGIWNLLGKLETLPSNKKCVPAGIHNAPALITHIKVRDVCGCAGRGGGGCPGSCLSTPFSVCRHY